MTTSRPTLSLCIFLGLCAAISGCDQTSSEPSAPEDSSSLRDHDDWGVWINNGLVHPDVTGIDPAFGLSSSEGLPESGVLLADPELRDSVRYLVECALRDDQSITKVVGGETLTFDGILGLAPEWETGACNEDCQEWVSACMLARTNVSGETVTIRMQADHPAIGTDPSLIYSAYEASFFGNLFDSGSGRYYCTGTVVGPLLSQLHGRTCTNIVGEPCDFVEYTTCEVEERCEWETVSLGLLGPLAPTAIGCMSGPLPGDHAHHTISTYVAPL